MSLEIHYVKSDGVDTDSSAAWDAATSFANRVKFAVALTRAEAGDVVHVCDGVTLTGATTPTNSGTAALPIIWQGCDANGNATTPTRTDGGALSTTNVPVFECGSGGRFDLSSKSYHVLRALKFNGNRANFLLSTSTLGYVDKCIIVNANTGTSGLAVTLASSVLINSDVTIAGTGAAYAISTASGSRVIGCRIVGAADGTGIYLGSRCAVCGCLIRNLSIGMIAAAAASYELTVFGNTIQACGTGIQLGNAAGNQVPAIANNIIRDNTLGVELAYATVLQACIGYNRVISNSSGNYEADLNDWQPGKGDASAAGSDFLSASDFRLLAASPSVSAGLLTSNIGAFGGGFPAVTEVLDDVVYGGTLAGTYVEPAETDVRDGINFGDGSQGSCVVPAAADVLRDVPVDVNGTGLLYVPTVNQVLDGVSVGVSGSGTVVLPSIADVRDGTFYGAGGNGLEGECVVYLYGDDSDYKVLTTAAGAGTYVAVDAGNVRDGVPVGPSPSAGTLKVPAEDVVKLNEHYGAGGTEYTGEYIGGGGGGRKRLGALRG